MYVIGIDGGGTKTIGVICDANGRVVSEATVGATNPNSVSIKNLKMELKQLFNLLQKNDKNVFTKVKHIFVGMSGADHPAIRQNISNLILSLVPDSMKLTVDNDAIIALYSGTFGDPGIVQIAGTGSITYGENENAIRDRVGGWGYLFGEKGSGYALGSEGLSAAFLAHDGLGDETILVSLFKKHFRVNHLPDIVPMVYHSKNVKETIASLSTLVFNASDKGDKVAEKIIRENSYLMGESISCLINKLFSKRQSVPVVLTGGIFNRYDLMKDTLELVVTNNNHHVDFILPKIPPVGGAVIAALLKEDLEINQNFQYHFMS